MSKRIAGALCALVLLGSCDNARRMYGASADALAGKAAPPAAEKKAAFDRDDKEDAPAAPAPMQAAAANALGLGGLGTKAEAELP